MIKPIRLVGWAICACLALAGCGGGKSDPKAEAPPARKVQSAADENVFEADRRIHELAVRFSKFVREARLRLPPRKEVTASASHISAVKCEKP